MRARLFWLGLLVVSGVAHAQGIERVDRVAPPPGLDAGDRFGLGVATGGDWTVVGAPTDQYDGGSGAVYLFQRMSEGWVSRGRLTHSDGAASARFGDGVDIEGDRVVVGARGEWDATGALYVFEREDGNWHQTARLRPDSAAGFGQAVALSEGRVLVRSTQATDNAYIVEENDGGWAVADTLRGIGRHYGLGGLDLEGDRAALLGGSPNVVGVFERGAGGWHEVFRDTLEATRGTPEIDLSGDRLAAGFDTEAGPRVRIYQRRTQGWVLADSLDLTQDSGSRNFLGEFGFDGDLLVAHIRVAGASPAVLVAYDLSDPGSPPTILPDPDGRASYESTLQMVAEDGRVILGNMSADRESTHRGRAWVYERDPDGGAWTAEELVVPGASRSGNRFGDAVAIDGSRIAVAAAGQSTVRIYRQDDIRDTWVEEAVIPLRERNDISVTVSLALDGDQLVIGDAAKGVVRTVRRETATWTEANQLSGPALFGASLAVDNGRLLVGAPGAGAGAGQASLYEANGDWWQPVTTLHGEMEDVRFGIAVALDGGRALVSARTRREDGGYGRVAVFEGEGRHWVRVGELTPAGGGVFGDAVALGGGWALASAPAFSGPSAEAEPVTVSRGTRLLTVATLSSPLPSRSLFGTALAVDGDRVVVGASTADAAAGAAFLFEFDGLAWSAPQEIPRPASGGDLRFGSAVAIDGRRFIVGAPGERVDAPSAGAVFVYRSTFATPSDDDAPHLLASLSAPSPNPSQTLARSTLTVPAPSWATVTVHDALGRTVQTVLDRDVGTQTEVSVDTRSLAAGLYLLRAVWEGGSATRHLAVVR